MKRVILVHGWEGSLESNWFPWLKGELESWGLEVIIPEMPDTDEPKIGPWVSKLREVVGEIDEDTFLIGHSIGCQAIMRYLESLKGDEMFGGIVFVAGFFNLPYLKTQEEKDIAKPWLEIPIDTERVKKHSDVFMAIFSDDDPDIPLSDKDLFEDRLGAKIIVESGKGHFTENEYPEILDNILEEMK